MPQDTLINYFGNPFVKILLRSPLHHFIDKNVVLIQYTGRKTGEPRSVPVNYLQMGNILHIISLKNRNWWRSMRGGASVRVLMNGKERNGWAELVEDNKKVTSELRLIYTEHPQNAHFIQIGLDENRKPLEADLQVAAKKRVAILIQLS
jgi:hypothetical protein